MKSYPLQFTVKPYRGKDQKRQAKYQANLRTARRIKEYINDQAKASLKPGDFTSFLYFDIANALNIDKDTVKEILFPVDGGSNGIGISMKGS